MEGHEKKTAAVEDRHRERAKGYIAETAHTWMSDPVAAIMDAYAQGFAQGEGEERERQHRDRRIAQVDYEAIEWGGDGGLMLKGHGHDPELVYELLMFEYGFDQSEAEGMQIVECHIRKYPDPTEEYSYRMKKSAPGPGAFEATLVIP